MDNKIIITSGIGTKINYFATKRISILLIHLIIHWNFNKDHIFLGHGWQSTYFVAWLNSKGSANEKVLFENYRFPAMFPKHGKTRKHSVGDIHEQYRLLYTVKYSATHELCVSGGKTKKQSFRSRNLGLE